MGLWSGRDPGESLGVRGGPRPAGGELDNQGCRDWRRVPAVSVGRGEAAVPGVPDCPLCDLPHGDLCGQLLTAAMGVRPGDGFRCFPPSWTAPSSPHHAEISPDQRGWVRRALT